MTAGATLPSSLLALATTVHLCLAALRNHRHPTASAVSPAALVSFALVLAPWVLPTTAGIVLGLAVHAIWLMACELFAPKKTPTRGAARAAAAGEAPRTARPQTAGPAGAAARPRGFVPVPVLAAFDETDDIKTIRVARPEGFEFEAGQFVTVRLGIEGRELARCYSISSAPEARGYLEISVKRQGVVSSALHAVARPGASLAMRSPTGAFRYPSADDRPIVLIAGGVGITPLMSMLRHAVATEPSRPVTLLYSGRTPRDFAFRDEITAIARRHQQVRAHFAATRAASGPEIYPGRINDTLLRATLPDIAGSICLLCGPTPMIDGMRALLASLGVPPAQVRSEVFEAAIAAAAATAPDRRQTAGTPGRRAGRSMVCTIDGRRVQVRPAQTLLEAAETHGIDIPSMCRAGVCGTCRVRVTEGEVDCDSNTLDADERAQGFVLACVTSMRSDCSVCV